MSTQPQLEVAASAAPHPNPVKPALRRVDALDEPARAPGPKRAALQARRQTASAGRCRSDGKGLATMSHGIVVRSADAVLTFGVVPLGRGVLVRRTYCPPRGPRIVQVMKFDGADRFDDWCSRDPLRFEQTMFFQDLLRRCHELLHRTA